MSERFFQSNKPEYLHPVCSELENSGIRVGSVIAVSLNVGRSAILLIKLTKLYMCKKSISTTVVNKGEHTAPGVSGLGSVPLSHSGNVVMRIGLKQL